MLETIDHGPVREIKLDRPPANALNPELTQALHEALHQAGGVAEAVVVSGRPGMFSAGLDVPLFLTLLVRSCVKIESNQSATGILYVEVVFVIIGEAIALHMLVTGGLLL